MSFADGASATTSHGGATGHPGAAERSVAAATGWGDAPVGVFDSGVGGLSVLRKIRRQRPGLNLIYVADSAHAPYGDQSTEAIVARATVMVRFLLGQGAKAIVVACNTATVVAVHSLRAWCPVPLIALEPAIKPAVRLSRSKVIGVLATRRTITSASVRRLCVEHGGGVSIVLQACPGLVECVEAADLTSASTRALLLSCVTPSLDAGADTLVLGCTHYSFLQPTLSTLVGPQVTVLDSAAAVARELARRLGLPADLGSGTAKKAAPVRFFSTAAPAAASDVMSALLGERAEVGTV